MLYVLLLSAATPSDSFLLDLQAAFALHFDISQSERLIIAHRGGSADEAQRYGDAFVRDVVPRYFDAPLTQAQRIAVFENKRAFVRHTQMDAFGFYAYDDRTIYTYARSGYGTLWHELMHAAVHQNAKCTPPDWFNEGLASFYEMAVLRDGHVVGGFTNWRHPILKAAIERGKVTPLATLMRKTELSAADLALARFVFVYLWLHGELESFARAYLRDCPTVPLWRGEPLARIEADLLKIAWETPANIELTPRVKSATPTGNGR